MFGIVRLVLAVTMMMATSAQPDHAPEIVDEIRSQEQGQANHEAAPTNAEQLLDRLESAGEQLDSLSARIQFTKEQGLLGDIQTRTGQLYFQTDSNDRTTRRFHVEFRQFIFGDERREEDRNFIFNGRWLIERINDRKQFIKRELTDEQQAIDPLSIEGPFPLPIGQMKADVLKRFDAELLEPETEGRLEGFYKLHLNALDDDDDIDEVTLWYEPTMLVPWEVLLHESNGDIKIVKLAKVQIGVELDSSLFDVTEPSEEEGWTVTVERYDPEDVGS